MDKINILRLAVAFLSALLFLFKILVVNRCTKERRAGMNVFSLGFLVAIVGLGVAVFINEITLGARIILFGILISAIGLAIVWGSRNQH